MKFKLPNICSTNPPLTSCKIFIVNIFLLKNALSNNQMRKYNKKDDEDAAKQMEFVSLNVLSLFF